MKVMLLNGSPHEKGCVYTALSEVASALKENGVDSEIFWIGNEPVRGCIACYQCKKPGAKGCAFRDPVYDNFIAKMAEADALIVGSPVYYAGPAGSLCAFLDRAFISAPQIFTRKPAACVVNCRRGGASATYDRLNKYFTISQMPVVSTNYWNSTHGTSPAEVLQDKEGLQTMRVLANNMAYTLKSLEKAALPFPEMEPKIKTSYIR